ncbi:SCO2521 family protein [Streptomyces sp. NPDC002763]|uniref:SCO2521 family protein n=1 Tax=Streptomyces sp. NPDC002763 TaxID=3154427 RepID=UPI00332C8F6B
MSVPNTTPRTVLACGEVRTGLLPARDAVDERTAVRLLRLRADERVRLSRRPIRCAVSPDLLSGVDCRLPTATGAKVRAVGTVTAHAVLTEGRILQANAYFSAPDSGPDRRQTWGYYLVRPGLLVPVGRMPAEVVAAGFLAGQRQGELNVGTITESLLARIERRHELLDYDLPLTTVSTRLRWAVLPPGGAGPPLRFTVDGDSKRSVELRTPQGTEPAAVAALCEDLALHDWLLTVLGDRLDGLRPGSAPATTVLKTLRPVVDHLLHLWMPRARVDRELWPLWEILEEWPGFTRQWQTLVQRVRDQLTLRAVSSEHGSLTPY